MRSIRLTAPAVGALVAALLSPAPASAQGPPTRADRPYRGMFGSGATDAGQSLIATGSVGGGYDTNVFADLTESHGSTLSNPLLARPGVVGSLSGGLEYAIHQRKVDFGASFGDAFRYYPQNRGTTVNSYGESSGVSYRPSRRTTLTANQFISYQPFMLSLFPSLFAARLGNVTLPPVDLAPGLVSYRTYGAGVGFTQDLARRLQLFGGYSAEQSDTPYVNSSLGQRGGTIALRFGLSKYIGLRVGYTRRDGRYTTIPGSVMMETYDVGIDMQKPLSVSRRTTLEFRTGTSAVQNPQLPEDRQRTYYVTGSARLNHEMGRSWLAAGGYERSVQFVDTLLQPVLADSFNAYVGGLFDRRWEFTSGAQGSIGTLGFSQEKFHNYQAYASLAYALNRWSNVNVSYSYYQYFFDSQLFLPVGIARDFGRQAVRANLNLWAPLMNKKRRN